MNDSDEVLGSEEEALTTTSSFRIKKHTKFEQDKPLSGIQGSTTETAPCAQFDGYEAIAKFFLTELLEQSATEAEERKVVHLEEGEVSSSSSSAITFVEFFGSFTSWPTIQEFTVELGEDRIGEYLSTWYYEEDWLYCVDLKLQQSDGCCDYYIYETKWSLPTKEYPIAQATASIYFTIAVSRVKPQHCLVDVSKISHKIM
ncbi:a-kinase anchor protein 14 [Holotrichia oblita]|uniref:A-kinase anchor protein 14 n=1 Tax=Holotrichia oblita TaxID=644536 RepID=A0ACB9TKD1_HOLOL|nr:a-kinase anchor protein 14 [Holotrichia oblita]